MTRLCLLALVVAPTLAHAASCNGVSTNLVSNCGFETGSFAGWGGSTPNNLYSGIDSGDPLTPVATPYQGTYEAYLGSIAQTATLGQTLTTTPGQTYQVAFALLNDTSPVSPYTNLFQATFGNTVLYSQSNLAAGPWQLLTFLATATSTATPFFFTSQNQTGTFELDSVSVSPTGTAPVPEPSTLALLGAGLISAAAPLRRRLR